MLEFCNLFPKLKSFLRKQVLSSDQSQIELIQYARRNKVKKLRQLELKLEKKKDTIDMHELQSLIEERAKEQAELYKIENRLLSSDSVAR